MQNNAMKFYSCPACESDNVNEVQDCEGSEGTFTMKCECCEHEWEEDFND